MVTQHYMRQPPVGGPPPTDITIGPDNWTEESYTILAGDGSVARQVTFEPNPDGSLRKVNSTDGKQNTTYDAKGNVLHRITLPDPLPFDVGYAELTKYVNNLFPTSLKTEGKGSGVSTLVGEIDDPATNETLAQQAELAGLSPAKVLIRYEINEQNGLLADYQEIAVDANGKQTVVDEDRVTTAEVVSAPDFLSAGAQ